MCKRAFTSCRVFTESLFRSVHALPVQMPNFIPLFIQSAMGLFHPSCPPFVLNVPFVLSFYIKTPKHTVSLLTSCVYVWHSQVLGFFYLKKKKKVVARKILPHVSLLLCCCCHVLADRSGDFLWCGFAVWKDTARIFVFELNKNVHIPVFM